MCVAVCRTYVPPPIKKKRNRIIHLETVYHFEFRVLWYNLKGSLVKWKPVFVGKLIQCRQHVVKPIQKYLWKTQHLETRKRREKWKINQTFRSNTTISFLIVLLHPTGFEPVVYYQWFCNSTVLRPETRWWSVMVTCGLQAHVLRCKVRGKGHIVLHTGAVGWDISDTFNRQFLILIIKTR
jgi:hypothetical protein